MNREVVVLLLVLIAALGLLLFPRAAFADPHAVFYTDNGFKQVFYAVLAALNQADYVEPPTQPTPIPSPSPGYIDEFNYTKLDPDEVRLPRIRVRAVTPDDGDVYYRQQYAEVVRAARVRAELSALACKFYAWADPAEFDRHPECQQNIAGSSTGPNPP